LVSLNTLQQKQHKTLTRLFKPIARDEHQKKFKHEGELLEKVKEKYQVHSAEMSSWSPPRNSKQLYKQTK